jgi:hypothetical protein
VDALVDLLICVGVHLIISSDFFHACGLLQTSILHFVAVDFVVHGHFRLLQCLWIAPLSLSVNASMAAI